MTAIVQLPHSTPYYHIDSFRFDGGTSGEGSLPVLPAMEIERKEKDGKFTWVHRDTQRSSQASLAIGKTIEMSGHFQNYV